MQSLPFESPFGRVLTVSQVTQEIKELLEDSYPLVWIEGEISNLRLVQSGHAYFTLKDAKSQLRAVMFRSSVRQLPFTPEAGMQVIARGRLSVYEPRGDYQLIAEAIDPKGIGALQIAFEQLKERLFQEGLFDADRKLPLPAMPQCIGIVTSPTGAAIRDIIQVAHRRSANVHLFLYPVRVQGNEAAGEIVRAIAALNAFEPPLDVLIVGRGGGSLEDLWAFNEEAVAWAIAGSEIPIISAVGHETDTTIADFVADLRASTPSAAAELVVKSAEELRQQAGALLARLHTVVQHTLMRSATDLDRLASARPLRAPHRFVQARQQQVDDLMLQLDKAWANDVQGRTPAPGNRRQDAPQVEPALALAAAARAPRHPAPTPGDGRPVPPQPARPNAARPRRQTALAQPAGHPGARLRHLPRRRHATARHPRRARAAGPARGNWFCTTDNSPARLTDVRQNDAPPLAGGVEEG